MKHHLSNSTDPDEATLVRSQRVDLGGVLRRVRCGSPVLLVPLLFLAACGESSTPPPKSPTLVQVQAATLSSLASETTLTGQVSARVQSELAFRIAGRIAKRTVDVGDHVEAGQVLAALERTQQLSDVSAAKAGVAAAEASLREAAATYERQRVLLAQGFTTQPSYDRAKQALDGARAGLESAKAGLGTAEDALANIELRADAPGIITARNAEVGQFAAVGQPIYSVARDGPRDAVFDVFETLIGTSPQPDRVVEIRLLSDPSVRAIGKVREVSPTVDAANGTVRVKVGLDGSAAAMGLGAPVSGTGRFAPRDTIVLPWTAFFTAAGKPAVWVVDPQRKTVSLRQVEVQSYGTGELLLNKGLSVGDLVVTRGGQVLRPGQFVAVRNEAADRTETTKP
ncbi:efflux RND transporter periplasmic adaptor subunit [Roseixanthobacter glucoisosaccharinicivorans]|uniref:efflux RND transporter periplasmic adaptor subunit n=1 Tax=Roseixanthobacter glucoisosaccharinicivorans TaxID=3119923 RepID=UPI00372C0DDF